MREETVAALDADHLETVAAPGTLTSLNQRCIVCGSNEVDEVLVIELVPVQCNVLLPTRADALNAATGTIQLVYCGACGHLFNAAFDPELMTYTGSYENSLHYSPRFQSFLDSLIARLDNTYELRGKRVIDVGCGKGEFLRELCQQTGCTGVGFDRSYEPPAPGAEADDAPGPSFIVDFYGGQYASCPVDLLTCRHVLEHIDRPTAFIRMIHNTLAGHDRPAVFFEVPDAGYTVQQLGIWDLIYEHVSYFTPSSLGRLFVNAGFEVTRLDSEFEGQYLTIEGVRTDPPGRADVNIPMAPSLLADVQRFGDRYRRKVDEWCERVDSMRESGSRLAIWGTGSKGVTFLNALQIDHDLACAVDLNPRKVGKYVPGTGQRVVAPSELREYQPDAVFIMNQNYEREIRDILGSLDIDAEILLP